MKNYGWGSANLCMEIEYYSTSVNNPTINFYNGSWIHCVVASDSARHNRSNIILVDEFRLVDLSIINNVIRKFLTAPRMPGYLKKPEYKDKGYEERNCELYLSSAWYASHWSFDKLKAYYANMLDDTKRYFCCGLPYQLAIKEGLLSREQVEDEMSEGDFDSVSFLMEMCAIFYSDTDGAFFRFDDIQKRRKIKEAFYPLSTYTALKKKPPDLKLGERRILTVDVALMSSSKNKNDASCLTINSAIPNDSGEFVSNIVFVETYEGLTTDELGIIIMRTYEQYHCTDLVLDTGGIGISVYDFLTKDQLDPDYGVIYNAMSCRNDPVMAERCRTNGARKVIWSIKASQSFNSQIATLLRAGFQNGRINLLISEYEADEVIQKIQGYSKLSGIEKNALKIPYIQTSLMINEIINLEYTVVGENVKVKEKTNYRKDRYSSLAYSFKIASDISTQERKPTIEKEILKQFAYVRQPVRRAFNS